MVEPTGTTPVSSTIEGWSDLTALMEEHSDGTWIFRGVRSVEHELIPKIGRPYWRRNGFTDRVRPFNPEEEKTLLDAFRKQARPYITYPPDRDIEWLAIAQHHGLPTRLLDWSESILVAVYFAVENGGVGGPVAVYA